jgi:hypothetical protein
MAYTTPTRPKAKRKRPIIIRISVTAAERKELRLAALKADLPMSSFVRLLALAALRQGLSIATEVKKAA